MSRTRIARNAVFSAVQMVLGGVLLLLTYLVMMRYLTIAEIGLWSLIVGSTMVARLAEFGLGAGVLRFVAGDLGAGRTASAARTLGMGTAAATVLVGIPALIAHPFLHSYMLTNTPAQLHPAVTALLPPALIGVVIGTAANVVVSAIDGCHRIDLRAWLQVGSGAAQLALTWFVLPRWGLGALGHVGLAQAALLLLGGLVVAYRLLGRPISDYFGFDRARFKELLVFGGGMQLGAIPALLFDPLIRVLLTTYSGLTLTGYFEMANRIVTRFYNIAIAPLGALTPHVASSSVSAPHASGEIRSIYRESFSMLLYLQLPYYACLAAGMGLLLTLWKGQFDQLFLAVALLQLLGAFAKSLSVPAYMIYLGTGRLRWNILSQLAFCLIGLIFGLVLGELWGGTGVLIAATLALGGGAQISLIALHRENRITLGDLLSASSLPGAILLVLAGAASTWMAASSAAPHWGLLLGLPVLTGLAAALVLWRDPRRAALQASLPLRKPT